MATSGSYAYSTFGAFCLASICLAASTPLSAQSNSRAYPTESLPVVTICGDVMHSRVARSNAVLLRLFGAEVRMVGPRTLLPAELERLGVRVFDRIEPALEGADVVMVLRIQRERLQGALLPSLREYSRTFGIGTKQLAYAKPDALVMHPGPMNRGVEISNEVADGPRSAVLDQVEAGVAIRMAVLYLLAGEPGSDGASA